MDRPPGWTESLLAGRSRADKEADQDAQMLAMLLVGGLLGLLIIGLHAVFSAVGLQLGWWSAPVFLPVFAWLLVSAAARQALRQVELDVLRWRQRLAGGGGIGLVLWLVWPLWAGPTARAWKAAHGGLLPGGIAGNGPRYPLGAILGASPVLMGMVAFLLLVFVMTVCPRVREREHRRPGPPGGPQPLRAPLVSGRPSESLPMLPDRRRPPEPRPRLERRPDYRPDPWRLR
ncbi:MAG: hypothetical protein ACRDLF_09050 [Solirubrobacteraceae bacterium]